MRPNVLKLWVEKNGYRMCMCVFLQYRNLKPKARLLKNAFFISYNWVCVHFSMCVMVNGNTKRLGQQYSALLRWGLSTSAHLHECKHHVSGPGRPDVYPVQLIMNRTSKKTNTNNKKSLTKSQAWLQQCMKAKQVESWTNTSERKEKQARKDKWSRTVK